MNTLTLSERKTRVERRFAAYGSAWLCAATVVLMILCGFPSAQAASFLWDGGSGNSDNWSGSGPAGDHNWSSNDAPVNNGTADPHFAGSVRLTPNMNVSYSVNSITFDSGASAFTLGNTAGTTLTIQGGGFLNSDNSTQTINISAIALGASQTWNAGTVSGGSLVFGGSTLDLGMNQILTIAGSNNTSIANVMSGSGSGITKTGTGTLTVTGNNSYTGRTTISGGTLLLGSANRIADGSPMTLTTGGTFNTGGFNETVGALTLSASSTIDMGVGGASILHFADSSAIGWTGTLSILNWSGTTPGGGGTDQLFFGGNTSGLTSTQLSQISFFSEGGSFLGNGSILGTGEIVPVPEASTVAGALGLLGMVGWRERRKMLLARAFERRAFA